MGGYTKTESQLDFSGTPKQVVTRHKRLDTDVERLITENFTYDHQNRVLEHTHQVDGNAVEYLAQNEYNELSQLKSKKVGGTSAGNGLQTVDYKYNIRGWMTGINDPNDLSGGDLFGYKIKYNQVEGQQMPNNDFSGLLVQPKYNGNIAEVDWRTNTTVGDNLRRYSYVYDGLNRLRAGFYQRDDNPTAKEYFEKIDYDLNGNITNLKRSASKDGNAFASTIDNLSYVYENNNQSNRLITVTDSSQDYRGYPDTSGIAITYDLNGNMKKHEDRGILQIDYNFLNLPNYTMFNEGLSLRSGVIRNNLNYLYRADGVKLKKTYKYAPYDPWGTATQLETKTTEYLDGFQYEGQGLSLGGPKGGSAGLITSLQFVPTSEGYYDFVKNKYIYNYADHLGNTRLSYFHNGSGVEVLEENNYYPFGLKHEGYNALAGNPGYQYKYQGQELQETGFYSFKYREYMPDVGRFIQLDPLSEKFPYNSTYAIQENKMGMGIELEGLELLPHHSGYFAIKGNQMTVKQAPITQRDSFGRPSFRAGDIGLTTSGYNPNGARITDGTTGLKLNSYRYNGATGSDAKMESVRGDDRPTNIWTKIYDKGIDKVTKGFSGIKEVVKNVKMGLDIPEAIKSTNDYVNAVKDINSIEKQATTMDKAIDLVNSSGINMNTQTRNDVTNFVFDGTLPPGTDTQNGLIIQNGTSILNSNNIKIRPTQEQIKQTEINNR
ncbi:RHS repeat protein [Chryseobacterium formosense]|uniref:RHS repeat protein n=1 Tax=Chryseobacterium formosense TaxID=236814 RepID=UPI00068A4C14|nr:RHS repeat-associated core domain-containing protein [Chryseobacterium formosense]